MDIEQNQFKDLITEIKQENNHIEYITKSLENLEIEKMIKSK